MPDYPIYQPMNIRDLPDAKSMVIDWSGAVDKLARGAMEGVELGLKMRSVNQDIALKASQMQHLNTLTASEQLDLAFKQKHFDQRNEIADSEAAKTMMDLQFATNASERQRKLMEQKANLAIAQAHALTTEKTADSIQLFNDDPEAYDQLRNQVTETISEIEDNPNFAVAADKYRELQKSVQTQVAEYGKKIGKKLSVEDIAASLPANHYAKPLFDQMTAAGVQDLIRKTMIPIETDETTEANYTQAQALANSSSPDGKARGAALLAQAMQNAAYTKPYSIVGRHKVIFMPRDQAIAYLATREGEDQLDYLNEKYGGSPEFAKLYKKIKAATPGEKTTVPPPKTPAVSESLKTGETTLVTTPTGTKEVNTSWGTGVAAKIAAHREFVDLYSKTPAEVLGGIKVPTGLQTGHMASDQKDYWQKEALIQKQIMDSAKGGYAAKKASVVLSSIKDEFQKYMTPEEQKLGVDKVLFGETPAVTATTPVTAVVTVPTSAEVERTTPDGKVAIFDANTKQFLRYK